MAKAALRLMATGDAIINRRVSQLEDAEFVQLRELLAAADVAFSNLETTTPRQPLVPSAARHGLAMSAPARVLDELRWMGLNFFNLANNHACDYGWQAIADTLNELALRGVASAGAGRTLAEARAPGYLDSPRGRVALVGATCSNAVAVMAADPGRGTAGRPGVNPLRFSLDCILDEERFRHLRDIDEAIGTAEVRRNREAFGLFPNFAPRSRSGELRLLGARFVLGDRPGIRGRLHEGDLDGLQSSIGEARRQADLVVVSVHCHEGTGGDWNTGEPPDFLVQAAHLSIEAGADLVVGHGPHRLRGIEVYRGKPVLYSLGNFVFQLETVEPLPPELYEEQGLAVDSTPADFHDHWWVKPDGSPIAFAADPVWFEAVVADLEFEGDRLAAFRLHPVELGQSLGRPRRGVPRVVDAPRGRKILEKVADQSIPFGTRLSIESLQGRVAGLVDLGA